MSKTEEVTEIVTDAFVVSPTSQGRSAFHIGTVEDPETPICNKVTRDRQTNHTGGTWGDGSREWTQKDAEIIRRMSLRPCEDCLERLNEGLEK